MVSDGAVRSAATGAGFRRRRRRRRSLLAGDVSMGASADFSDCTDNATTAYISPMPDPLELELCAGEGPPAWVDPMLEELVASLATTAGAPTVECSPPLPVASHGVDASLGDTHSSVMFPDASSPVNEVVANFARVVCTEAPPPVLVALPPRRRS